MTTNSKTPRATTGVTRRGMLRATGATVAFGALGAPLKAIADGHESAPEQVLGVYRRSIGDHVVTTLLDGHLDIGLDALVGVDAETGRALLNDAHIAGDASPTPINGFVIQGGGRTILVDGGAGPAFGPTAGAMPRALEAAGVAPEDVDLLVATHLHPDHIGAFTDAQGAAAFPNAELAVHAADRAFWLEPSNFSGAPEMMVNFAAMATSAVGAYQDRLIIVDADREIAPGLSTVHLPGHTPGHMGLVLASGDETLMLWADIVHVGPIQFARPEVTIAFDVDADQAAETRARVFDQAATDTMEIAGSHVDFPGFGRLEVEGDGYRFTPSRWEYAL